MDTAIRQGADRGADRGEKDICIQTATTSFKNDYN